MKLYSDPIPLQLYFDSEKLFSGTITLKTINENMGPMDGNLARRCKVKEMELQRESLAFLSEVRLSAFQSWPMAYKE